MSSSPPIGVFDSGYGGLTILNAIRSLLPSYDYVYLGDNARAPYGTRSFDIVYQFTLQAVRRLFSLGCPLVILGCNTASAKALRTIQQHDLPTLAPDRRVLGIIRPTAEAVGSVTQSQHIGILATEGTVRSGSYELEIQKLYPDAVVTAQACPMWVPLVENAEYDSPGADYFVEDSLSRLLARDASIDTLVLGCTHFPLLLDKIRRYVPSHVHILSQGSYVASSLADYLQRHPDMQARLSQGGTCTYYTTESADRFRESASIFLGTPVDATHVSLS